MCSRGASLLPHSGVVTTPPGAQIGEMLGKLLLKTFYGHTVGELLALEVTLVGTIESLIAAELTATEEARVELTDVVLSKLSRERQLPPLPQLLDRRGDEAAATVEQGIRAVYKLRDRFAHGGRVAAHCQTWLEEACASGVTGGGRTRNC
jgi:hypothetical protein